MPDRLAVLADIHGNSWALDAVLAELRSLNIDRVIDLGDCAYGPLDPRGTLHRLRDLEATTVRGNQDRVDLDGSGSATDQWVFDQLDENSRAYLRGLPAMQVLDGEVLLCHGTPNSDTETLLEEVVETGARRRSPAGIASLTGPDTYQVVLCAHSHLQRMLPLDDGTLVVNPGSVGLPAYADSAPFPHAMESGSPHARYAILSRAGASWEVELRAVIYLWSAAADAARERGREDWAIALETGLAG